MDWPVMRAISPPHRVVPSRLTSQPCRFIPLSPRPPVSQRYLRSITPLSEGKTTNSWSQCHLNSASRKPTPSLPSAASRSAGSEQSPQGREPPSGATGHWWSSRGSAISHDPEFWETGDGRRETVDGRREMHARSLASLGMRCHPPPVACRLSPIACPVSCLPSPVCRLRSPVSRLPSPVSRLPSLRL